METPPRVLLGYALGFLALGIPLCAAIEACVHKPDYRWLLWPYISILLFLLSHLLTKPVCVRKD